MSVDANAHRMTLLRVTFPANGRGAINRLCSAEICKLATCHVPKNAELHDSEKLCIFASLRENPLPDIKDKLAQSRRDAKKDLNDGGYGSS
jgi:hypothetical protein